MGAVSGLAVGLVSSIVLILLSKNGLYTAETAPFPLANPGIVSIPLAFLLGIVGTLTSTDRGDPNINAEFEVRALTGIGAEKASPH